MRIWMSKASVEPKVRISETDIRFPGTSILRRVASGMPCRALRVRRRIAFHPEAMVPWWNVLAPIGVRRTGDFAGFGLARVVLSCCAVDHRAGREPEPARGARSSQR